MKIIQVVAGYSKGDGVGNVVIAIDHLLKKSGYETEIYNKSLSFKDIDSELFNKENVILYHLALQVDPVIPFLRCKKILIFHNITEPELLLGRGMGEVKTRCSAGLYDTEKVSSYFNTAITFSSYSKRTLVERGWEKSKVFVLPIIVRLENFKRKPDESVIDNYKDGKKNILFTGRIFPNKKQEDIIAAFAVYKKKYNSEARLFLVGKQGSRYYYAALLNYARRLGVENDVIFTGHVSFEEYLAYYSLADLFLCMSAHEGFCIPLVEAMYFNIPILAVDSSAVPDTLGGRGVLIKDRAPERVAGKMNFILSNIDYRKQIVEGEKRRLEELAPENLEKQYIQVLNRCINEALNCDIERKAKEKPFLVTEGVDYEIVDYDEKLTEKKPVIIYGMGNAGQKLYKSLVASGISVSCVCDRMRDEITDQYSTCEALISQEAIKKYHDGYYIISVQDKRSMVDIVVYLLKEGIREENVFIYDEKKGTVY